MSGKQGIGAAIGAALGVAAAPFTGGLSLGLVATGASLGGALGGSLDAAKAQKKLANSLIQPLKNTTPLPALNDSAIQAAKNNSLLALQSRSGRASTLLSNTQGTKTTFGS